jgi:hypothetical protein
VTDRTIRCHVQSEMFGGQCYDHYFCYLGQFVGEKNAFFVKNKCYI